VGLVRTSAVAASRKVSTKDWFGKRFTDRIFARRLCLGDAKSGLASNIALTCWARRSPLSGRGSGHGRPTDERPQFVRVASFFGLRAGLADQPSPRRFCNVRWASRTWQVVDGLKPSHRGSPPGAAHPLVPSATAVSLALHRSARCRMIADRSTRRAEACATGRPASSGSRRSKTAPSPWLCTACKIFRIATNQGAVDSTRLKMRCGFDQLQGFRE
jgi:hypothetical protein